MHSRESSVVSLGRLAGTTATGTTLLGGEANLRCRLSAFCTCVSRSKLLSARPPKWSPTLGSAWCFNRSLRLTLAVRRDVPYRVGYCPNA